jgi:hypothetical protein
MSDVVETETAPTDDLQFDRADVASETETSTDLHCHGCSQPLRHEYYAVGDVPMCGPCKDALEGEVAARTQPKRFFRALLYGIPAAMAGTAIYYAIMALTEYEIGLVAILIGFMVGAAVRAGSGPGGGRRYQLLAALLTYGAIVTTYIPFVIEGIEQAALEDEAAQAAMAPGVERTALADAPDDAAPPGDVAAAETVEAPPVGAGEIVLALVAIVAIAFMAPFLGGLENIIGILIIGFGVYQAWKMNKRAELEITGPHTLGGSSAESA